jgi:hypothetical protein
MATNVNASDWEAQGVAQVGVAVGVGGALYLFVFRSRYADCRAPFLFIGAGVGIGGNMGSGTAPSPSDIVQNVSPNMWSSIPCTRPFAASDLDVSYGALSTISVSVGLGYAGLGISAGLVDNLFDSANVSGWGTGVGAVGASMVGLWQMGKGFDSPYY